MIFGLGPATKVFLAAGSTDMRKGFSGLYGLVRDRLQSDPTSGYLYLFANARKTRLKVLFWDGSGLWVCGKQLAKGRFRWPDAGDEARIAMSHEELALLLHGIDLPPQGQRPVHHKLLTCQ
ncbi:MAG: IS66 family insertion sequence element accessory protein TnpB [Terracidiphilus sp.]|jgi:transposase